MNVRPERDRYLEVALAAARAAGEFLLERFGRVVSVEYKGATNLVTEADRGAEAIIREIIGDAYPEHRILGEEAGESRGAASDDAAANSVLWVVDPLDGTTNFLHGFPNFAVSIGVELEGEPVAGVVLAPVLNEIFTAKAGDGAYRNGERIRVSERHKLIECLLATGFPYEPVFGSWNTDNVAAFVPLVRDVRRFGSASLDLANVACGRLDGFWELGLSHWDVSAGRLLVTEAGGRVSDFDGRPLAGVFNRLIASNGFIHEEIIRVLRTAQS